jgi:hypothetical protein
MYTYIYLCVYKYIVYIIYIYDLCCTELFCFYSTTTLQHIIIIIIIINIIRQKYIDHKLYYFIYRTLRAYAVIKYIIYASIHYGMFNWLQIFFLYITIILVDYLRVAY